MGIDDRESKSIRPQTINHDMAGKWIAWSADGLRIVAVGDSFDACERRAVEAGFSPNLVAIEEVPAGREVGSGLYRITDTRWSVPRVLRRIILVAVTLVAFAVVFSAGTLLGLVAGTVWERDRRFSREREIMGSMLKKDPAFTGVKIGMYTADGAACLSGEVETKEQVERLRSNVKRLFGEAGEIDRMDGVSAKER